MNDNAFNFDLDKFRVTDVDSAYYIKDFITKKEEQELLNKPHEDGPFYYPTVVTISLKSYIILDFYKHLNSMNCIMAKANNGESKSYYSAPEFSLLLEPRRYIDDVWFFFFTHPTSLIKIMLLAQSLLVLKHDLYKTYLHGIQEVKFDNLNEKNILNYNLTDMADDFETNNCIILKRDKRISLTFRIVEKVVKTKLFNVAKK
ncbi:23689_t:CDS:2 [Gigaspora margarita]|uniref:23689_t:CDS:1 n=1 Tax=Gigaspora margarita TaxID=4874 RepID=A0ABN7W6A2_GIGMA|nr:23689_t:CDS:2 [Gigaspora margarita]